MLLHGEIQKDVFRTIPEGVPCAMPKLFEFKPNIKS